MSTKLILGVRLTPQTFSTVKLDNFSLDNKVEQLKTEAAFKVNLPKESLELIYCGCILEDDATLASYGLKSGVMVHVLKKKEPEVPVPAKPISEASVLHLASAFRSFNVNPALRSALHRLSKRSEVIENIISSSPGLSDDSVAIAMLQDPDLMAHFTDPDTVRRIAELHPCLVEAAQHIAAAVHEEAHSNSAGASNASTSSTHHTAYSYSLDNMSDDEEMAGDSSQSSDSTQPTGLSRNQSNSAITTAQLSAALARTRSRGFPLSTSSSTSGSRLITTEMFSQAIQQAFSSGSTQPLVPPLPPVLPQPSELQTQLAQMHEMGLQDDAVNVQALQFTNGDVQAAIELVFSGFSDT
ncbi:ubiquitin-like protein 7 [Athalia rosae]|uniref:ubiquitin-like protein 7 n=1 Tax=Athalia rosae TaxID=37344 RepID=UPI00062616A5|nr:ubiquitin-like protein 7 [Athalia rosae]